MCNYQTLVHNNSGYIIKCNQCAHLQLAFGTIVTSIDTELFDSIAEHLENEHSHSNASVDTGMKRITIPLDTHTMLCLTSKELSTLNDMFIQARALLDTYRILEHC